MAKISGPLLSFGARGQIGKSMVVAKWRGVPYARQYVQPSNPNTAGQQSTRGTFANWRGAWKLATANLVATWDAFAAGKKFTGMNAFVGQNLAATRGETDYAMFIGSPGSGGGLPLPGITVDVGALSGEIDVDFTAPDLPADWQITKAIAIAFPDGDPATAFEGPITEGTDATAPYSITLSGLTPGADYCVCAWLEYQKPNGSKAYSASITEIQAAKA